MTCDHYSEWIGDAVDGTLDAARQAEVDAHCRACAGCRELLGDLKDIRAAAATLDRPTPSPELWRAIAARIQTPRIASVRPWRALAAAAALVSMLGAAAWFGLATGRRGGSETANELARNAATELQLAEQHYQNAISALEQLTVNKDTALDPAIAAQIAQSLASIDRAIDDSRAALRSDPGSFVAQTSLLEALRMKVALLQETVSLMNARS